MALVAYRMEDNFCIRSAKLQDWVKLEQLQIPASIKSGRDGIKRFEQISLAMRHN